MSFMILRVIASVQRNAEGMVNSVVIVVGAHNASSVCACLQQAHATGIIWTLVCVRDEYSCTKKVVRQHNNNNNRADMEDVPCIQ